MSKGWTRRTKYIVALVGLCALLGFIPLCMSKSVNAEMAGVLETVRAELGALEVTENPVYSDATKRYFAFYGLDVPNGNHHFGTVELAGYTIAVHLYTPEKSRGMVMISHGYYDHAGVWRHVIKRLTDEGYTVAVYDQPGHGLSSGDRATIKSFDEYVKVLEGFIALSQGWAKGPYHLAAHSTGCSAVLDYLLHNKEVPVANVVLVAPLIRSVAWGISGLGQSIGGKVVDSVPRKFRKNSSDKEFLKFMKADPLQPRTVPLEWVRAHRAWTETVLAADASSKPIRVIQGQDDTTVAWRYNLGVLRQQFTAIDVKLIEKGGHQLINESEVLRKRTLDLMVEWLAQ